MKVTILTPTYNRKDNLINLYNSLLKQTNNNFEWLIVDDGSTDNTNMKVNEFIKEDKIKIIYYEKENGGKHTALNFGISKIDTDLTFIVDSDDWLKDNAIDEILSIHSKYKDKEDICGYSFLRMFSNGEINGKTSDKEEVVSDYICARINGDDMNSDKAEVWKTICLKEYPFPEFKGEKFLGEDVVWIPLALKYKMVFLNKPIYISEYLENGLTKNRRKNNIKSPNGCYYKSKLIIDISKEKKINLKYLMKNIMQYIIYGNFSNKSFKELFKKCNRKFEFLILYPVSWIIYLKWKKEYIK